MEYPNNSNPKPLRFIVDTNGVRGDTQQSTSIITSPAPRAG